MEQVKVILKKSMIGSTKSQKSAVRALSLKKPNQSVVVVLTPAVKGQINKIRHLLTVESK